MKVTGNPSYIKRVGKTERKFGLGQVPCFFQEDCTHHDLPFFPPRTRFFNTEHQGSIKNQGYSVLKKIL